MPKVATNSAVTATAAEAALNNPVGVDPKTLVPNSKDCCVCYNSFEDLVKLECGHEFCEKCADSIINHSHSLKCALCRKKSYHIEHEKLDKKIFHVELYGPSYIEWRNEMARRLYTHEVLVSLEFWLALDARFVCSTLRGFYYIHRIYWYYGDEYPYTYHNPMIRSYKCKI